MPRQLVFWGSTNTSDYLRDATVNRRFWPVSTGDIDLEALRIDRDQIWAEAAYYERQGEPLELPEELWGLVTGPQANRMEGDPWEDALRGIEDGLYVNTVGSFYRNSAPAIRQLVLELKNATRADNRRLADVMRGLGWVGPAPMSLGDGKPSIRAYEKAIVLVRAEALDETLGVLASHAVDIPKEWTDAAASARKIGVELVLASESYRRALEERRGSGPKASHKVTNDADARCARAKTEFNALEGAAGRALVEVEAIAGKARAIAKCSGIRLPEAAAKPCI